MRVGTGVSSSGPSRRRRRAAAAARRIPVISQPGRHEQPRVGHHPERVGRDGQLAGGAEQAGGHLTGGEQAERELADPPAEPDRRLAHG